MDAERVREGGRFELGTARVLPFVQRRQDADVAVLRDTAGVYYAVPREVLACYRVAETRLPELAVDLAGRDVAALGDEHFVGGVLRTTVHIHGPTGGGRH